MIRLAEQFAVAAAYVLLMVFLAPQPWELVFRLFERKRDDLAD